MARGRDVALVAIMLLGLLLLHSEVAHATTRYVVGESRGWNMNGWTAQTRDWPKGKHFKKGDILVFNYDPAEYDLVKVDKASYESCSPENGQTFNTGKDEIVLDEGPNYFISSKHRCIDTAMEVVAEP